MNISLKSVVISTVLSFIIVYPSYSQSSKPRTQSSRTAKNNTSVQTKQVAVKSINSPRSHRVNKQWEKNTTLGMYSSFPSKTNKYSRKNFNIDVPSNDDETAQEDEQKQSGLEKKEKEGFWKKLKLFKKE